MDDKIAELEQQIAKLEENYKELITFKVSWDDELPEKVLKALQNATRNAGRHPL